MQNDDSKSQSAVFALSIFLGALFLAYCTVYLCACPSPALGCAVGAELVAFVISIVILRAKVFCLPEKWLSKIPESTRKLFGNANLCFNRVKLVLLSVLSFVAAVDFAALCLSILGLYGAAMAMYTWLPVSHWIGLHPAFTLETLAGALVQNGDFDRAEPLFQEVKAIRIKLAGPNSDLASAVYADLGDLYVRRNDLRSAEKWYRQSIALGAHTGRAYTGLATALRELGKHDESRQWYLKALSIRKAIYGEKSKQYADTLRGYMRLQEISKNSL